MEGKLIFERETYLIRGACFEVYKQFGGAFKESVIDRALQIALRERKLSIETQKRIEIYFKDIKVGTYVPDIIINNQIILELKCKPFITKQDEEQFWKYLKGSQYKLGLLINFSPTGLKIKRVAYETARKNKNPRSSAF